MEKSKAIAGADAAFGLQDELLPHGGRHADGLGEDLLAGSLAVDVRMVKKHGACIQRGLYEALRLGGCNAVDAHAAHRDHGDLQTGGS